MNFKNIENYLKKNYKFVIIICLFLFLIMSDKENFSTSDALNAVKSTEKKVNEIFSHVDANKATMKKHLHLNNHLSLQEKQIRIKNAGDANHVIFYNKGIDGPEMKGWNGISLATGVGGAKRVVEIKKDYMKVNAKLCVGGTCINEDDLKKMKSSRMIGGYAVDGGGSTIPLEEGGWWNLCCEGNQKYNAWSNDAWDVVFLYRGWKAQFSEHPSGKGWVKTYENKNENVKKFHPPGNRISSYKLWWVGY